MNDLEDRITEALNERAGISGVRPMPPETARTIRGRQVLTSTLVVSLVATILVVGGVLSVVDRGLAGVQRRRWDRRTTSWSTCRTGGRRSRFLDPSAGLHL